MIGIGTRTVEIGVANYAQVASETLELHPHALPVLLETFCALRAW